MRTVNQKQPKYIITSDWHLREDTPICYTGDFENDQWDVVNFISELQARYNCPVLCAGDLFHHWKPSPYLLSKTIQHLPNKFYTLYGNHDLPQHSFELVHKSGIYTLNEARILFTEPDAGNPIYLNFEFCHFNKTPFAVEPNEYLLWHIFNYKGEKPWPTCTSLTAKEILQKYPAYDLIVTGDNHQTFVETYNGRTLINPGSIMRQSAAQIDFKPSVFLWFDDNTYKQIFLPCKEGVISHAHIDKKEMRENRLEAFISKLDDTFGITLSFEENLKKFQLDNNIDPKIIDIINKSLEPIKQ